MGTIYQEGQRSDYRINLVCQANVKILRKVQANELKSWLRGLDSNQDNQLQRLVSYQLDDPGTDSRIVAEARHRTQAPQRCA